MNPQNNSGKKKTIAVVLIIVAVVLAVIGVAVGVVVNRIKSPEFRYELALKLGDEYFTNRNNELAIEQYELAMKLIPENLQAYKSLAMVYANEHEVDEMFDIYELAEDNLGRSDFKDFQEYFFIRMGHIIEYEIKHEEYGEADKYIEAVAELDEDKADEFREEYYSDIDRDTVAPDAEPADPEEPGEPEPSEDPVPEENDKPLSVGYEVGEQVPDFEFYDEDGVSHSISEFRGKPVYINFFTTWCTYCFYELPDMEEIYDKNDGDVVFIMIDLDEGPELGVQYAEDYDVTIPIYYVDGWEIDGLEIEAVPLSIVIDGNGVVCGNQLGQASYSWMENTVNDAIESTK